VEKDEAVAAVVEDVVVVEENEEDTLAAVVGVTVDAVGAEEIVEVEEAVEDVEDRRESLEGECLFLLLVVVRRRRRRRRRRRCMRFECSRALLSFMPKFASAVAVHHARPWSQ
jgi:hypothetical protein